MPFLRQLYPDVPIVAIEEDVLFLNFYRKIGLAKSAFQRRIAEYQHKNVRKKGLAALEKAQLVVTNNPKDGKLLGENHISAKWFIEKVMPLLPKEFRFVVVGARPQKELLEMQSERVRILGFVEDISPYFSECICLAAPLLLGAGIKVKILEAMSAGVPVLTSNEEKFDIILKAFPVTKRLIWEIDALSPVDVLKPKRDMMI